MTRKTETTETIRGIIAHDLDKQAVRFIRLKGGRNSQVFRVDCSDGSVFAVKHYFRSDTDRRDRMACEFRALRFLKRAGIDEVPSALAIDEENGAAIYEFIFGEPVAAGKAAVADIDKVLAFLGSLRRLVKAATEAPPAPASEACFSVNALFSNLDHRSERLIFASRNEPELAAFLDREFLPFRNALEPWCLDFCAKNDIDPSAEIQRIAQTLSPSDFGFHNALQRADGSLVFVDFEYFGWDDPAKTISDFLLHPGMQLSPELKQRFFAGASSLFADIPQICPRVRAVYPLFGLKWCTILLNEFTLDHMARRRFADHSPGVWSPALQLQKARRMLARTMDEHRNFPYDA